MLNTLADAPAHIPACALAGAATAPAAPAPFRLRAAELKALAQRSNGPALRQTLVHLGAIALTGALLWQALGTVWAVPLTLLLGYLQAFLFTALHECAHQTAFRSRAGNTLLGHLSGLAILLPFEYYRAFH
jgi:fatty acid desaturase